MVTFLPRMLLGILVSSVLADSVTLGNDPASSGDEAIAETAAAEEVTEAELKSMAQRALALLEAGSAGSAEQRICFTCHSQSHPVLAIVEAKRRGFSIDEENLATQVRHTAEHLNRGRKEYLEGRGQGGKSDTAGYALWTLQAGDFANPETTGPVVDWLLSQQLPVGNWKRSSDRPPSEASHFATTYVALKGILDHATSPLFEVAAAEATESGVAEPSGDSQPVDEAEPAASEKPAATEATTTGEKSTASDDATPEDNDKAAENADSVPSTTPADAVLLARTWLVDAKPVDTEDRVFRLLALSLVSAPEAAITAAAGELIDSQREDGGWGQLDTMDSDAYATGTALYALRQTGQLATDAAPYLRGLRFLVKTQHDDGSWHVVSRSRPFQAYYETGFPHGKDQFISTSATAWATLAILTALPDEPASQP